MMRSATPHPCRYFSIEVIKSATNDFDEKLFIGAGGFARVYKATIGGEVMAIKRLNSKSESEAAAFRAEIKMLSQLRHSNLLPLIGYCDDDNEMIIVYEYMPQGSLYYHLHKADTHLKWMQRLQIAIEAGLGLVYLHTLDDNTQQGIVHRDVKSENILLTADLVGIVSDFGLSKISPSTQSSLDLNASRSVKGTFGYADPVYLQTGALSRKTDVYAFGVVLFELLSGKRALDERLTEDCNSLVWWAQRCVGERDLQQLVDSNMIGTIAPECLTRFARIAASCLERVPEQRPTMTTVVAQLQTLKEIQQKWLGHIATLNGAKILRRCEKMTPVYYGNSSNSEQSGTSSPKSPESNMSECSSHNENDEIAHQHGELVAGGLKVFTHSELKRVTSCFGDHKWLGNGTNADVYKGWVDKTTYLPSGNNNNTRLPIAVKRLHGYKFAGLDQLRLDLETMKEFSHPNHVKLIGYCLEDEQLFLVYEFMNNGNLEDLLRNGDIARLALVTKVKIVLGIARGLSLLNGIHEDIEHPWQVKASESEFYRHNILLDEGFTAKLSDYDVTKLVHGRYSWMEYIPEKNIPQPSRRRSGLDGFLMVFAEVLTGRQIPDSLLYKFDYPLHPRGKKSLRYIAELCFKTCNEGDSELKMVKILNKYDKYISALVMRETQL